MILKMIAAYDPRDPSQVVDDPSTWKATSNAALIVAHLTHAHFGEASVEWPVVALAAEQYGRNSAAQRAVTKIVRGKSFAIPPRAHRALH